mgnify:CR=1 FL=1
MLRTESECIDYIHSAGRFGKKAGLDNINALLNHMGNPEKDLKCIHIAGTNGKGSCAAMSANVLKSAIAKYLAYRKEKAREGPVKPCGKQSVKQLVGQNQGVSNIEITDKNIKDFERIARKYGVDFALKKDKTGDIPKYLVFFKARDADALTSAFKEYTAKTDRKKERPSVLKKLRKFKEVAADIDTPKVRKKELDAR